MPGRTDLAAAPRSRFALPEKSPGLLSAPERERALGFVRALLESPTAPYFEDGPSRVVRRFVEERPGMELTSDRHANLVVTWKGRGKQSRTPRLAFSAHLDHPAFHGPTRTGGVLRAAFHGGVPARFMPGAPLRFFDASGTALATARVRSAAVGRDGKIVAELADVRGRPKEPCFGVFDLTDGYMRGKRLHSRACDDLMGAAAILCVLDAAWRAREPLPLLGIFTRAEETGFVGCIGLLEQGLLPDGVRVVGLECSPRRAAARVGRGPVIRVGDRLSVFDPAITLELEAAAARIAARAPAFRVQRALMDGGACESTAYNAWGVRAGGLCLALGNYHNCGPDGRIAPEFVDWNDFEGLVALMQECARSSGTEAAAKMQVRLKRNWRREYKRLTASAARLAMATPSRRRDKGRNERGTRP